MENVGYVSLSHQMALREQMTLSANNVANMSTPGYKGQDTLFHEHLIKGKTAEDDLSQVVDSEGFRRMDQGPLKQTHNPLDLAITGDGYFTVETPEGPRYTRAGNFALNNEGQIVTAQGHPVLDEAGAPIQIPEGENQITVTSKGGVSTEEGEVATLKLVNFDNPQALKQIGDGLYIAEDMEEVAAPEASVLQGAIEGSNVQPVLEMTKMLEILRTYQSVQKMVQTDHDRIRSTIRKLAETQ
ncbi:MAG: flagellar basal-body rod protein FlgF [Pseudomonadota bacterium]